ncbi:MAG: NTP transferase domain-containing protein [Flammeovirgaceae bacterium]
MKRNRKALVGLILCGGQSSRMGQDKGLMKTDGELWAKRLEMLLAKEGISEVFFSVGSHNYAAYAEHFPTHQLVLDQAFSNIPTPLIGILSTYAQLKKQRMSKDLLVLACDLQQVDSAVLHQLFQAYSNYPAYPIHLLADDAYEQPLAGIYTTEGLAQLHFETQKINEKSDSLRSMVKRIHAQVIKLPLAMQSKLKNFNAPEDLE